MTEKKSNGNKTLPITETLLRNRWGRDQKVISGDEVMLAPFRSGILGGEEYDPSGFLGIMTEGLEPGKRYVIKRMERQDDAVMIYLDRGNGKEEGYFAEYLQAVDERKKKTKVDIKVHEFITENDDDVIEKLQEEFRKKTGKIDLCFRVIECPYEDDHTHNFNQVAIFPVDKRGLCKVVVTIGRETIEIKLHPEKVQAVFVAAGKKHSIKPYGFNSYKVACDGL